MQKGKIIVDTFESACLRNNPLNDPHIRELPVYQPPDYESSDTQYPVIFMLTGFTGSGPMLLNREGFSERIDERIDRLISQGLMKPAIVVMPDCFTYYGGSQYLNSAALGQYETYVTEELAQHVQQNYRVSDNSSHWAVMGKSSGGYGAIVLGMRHPELFGVVACHSGDMAFEYCYIPDFPAAMIEYEKFGSIDAFMKDFYAQPKKKSSSFPALNTFAMAAAYSPNPNAKPDAIDLPFNLKTCELREDVWERWLAWDPVRMIEKHEENLRKLKIFIDCGIHDEFRLYAGSRIFCSKLDPLGIKYNYEEFEDTHMKITYRYDRSLEFISKAFDQAG